MCRFDFSWIETRLATHRPELIDPGSVPRRAAVAIIFRRASEGAETIATWELLFIHRSQHSEDPWSGHMAFPGGRLEDHDPSPLHTSRRETLEEVGIDLEKDARHLGQIDDIRASARGRILPLSISPFVFLLLRTVEIQKNDEVDATLWVPVGRLLDPASASTIPYDLDGQRYHLPCFNISGRIIWGLTYQMVLRLFALLEWR
jgi:8-oxo-dGTP pyrophosphatase MutT (NUDIX family)